MINVDLSLRIRVDISVDIFYEMWGVRYSDLSNKLELSVSLMWKFIM